MNECSGHWSVLVVNRQKGPVRYGGLTIACAPPSANAVRGVVNYFSIIACWKGGMSEQEKGLAGILKVRAVASWCSEHRRCEIDYVDS
ncbi:hypothetical protein JTE90_028332 [Oedothorax gibbosus]|uniref:Ubiquitin-like protease family profile domain-containing protein n=1 Tax=Oedothorax gibbosus TaxID=931172 RepID=A0AAV6V4K0_9ARAC|nr:hypothetical protein JTE90_028332 [Oedothorax gibbosus]